MDFPTVRYDSVRERYSFEAKFGTRPNFKIILGGNISSTAFNQAYIGINYKNIGRVAQQLGADLYLGPIYTWGAIGGRTDFYAWKPIFLDYSYNFAVRNFRHGYFGNVTKVRNAQQVKNSESFFSTGVGMPLTHRSLLTLRANAGHVNYRYDSDVLFADDTDHSRFSFFGLRAGSPAIRSTSSSIPAAAPNCISRPSMSPDATNTSLTMRKTSFRAKPDSGSEGVFRGISSSMCRASAGSRSV